MHTILFKHKFSVARPSKQPLTRPGSVLTKVAANEHFIFGMASVPRVRWSVIEVRTDDGSVRKYDLDDRNRIIVTAPHKRQRARMELFQAFREKLEMDEGKEADPPVPTRENRAPAPPTWMNPSGHFGLEFLTFGS
jgi:hypothetical protein